MEMNNYDDDTTGYVAEFWAAVETNENDNGAPISVTLTDPSLLDCPICFSSLAPPIFRCENGHTACSSCCTKLRNICRYCSHPIGHIRCRAIEKFLESIKVSCQYIKYGCKDTICFTKKHEHEKTCIHQPVSNQNSSVTLKSLTEIMPRWSQHRLQKAFLVVPKEFLNHCSEHDVVICIHKKPIDFLGNVLDMRTTRTMTT